MKILHTVIKNYSPSVNKTLLKFGYKIATDAIYVYCRLKIVQEQREGKHKAELDEVVKWSADHNILASGQHSASDCCVQ